MLGLLTTTVTAAGQPLDPQPGCQYFEEKGHNLCEPFLAYWEGNGGHETFGAPQAEAMNELNLDLQQEILTQYFERGRLEQHLENSGTSYSIVLGRLGNEMLLELGRDWRTFPQADPSAEHYFGVTGHAIAPDFWEYWSSYGLDLGDDGVSFRESLALFGYPISEAEVETNMDGDTVQTQWFERARFELDGEEVRLGLLGDEILDLRGGTKPPSPLPAVGKVIADMLENPRGLAVGSDGAVYVAEAGIAGDECQTATGTDGAEVETCFGTTSKVTRIAEDDVSTVASGLSSMLDIRGDIVGAQDVAIGDDGTVYAVVGLSAAPEARENFPAVASQLGYIVAAQPGDESTIVVDVASYESATNPAGGALDSNPYSLVTDGDGGWVIADAGMNALLHIDAEGIVSTLAVFEDRLVEGPEGADVPMQSVPTGIAIGPDGAFYVGELTGFPFEVGAARVWRVTADGEAEIYAEGFTNVIDVAFDVEGNLYVLEMVTGSLLNADPDVPESLAARLVKVTPDGAQVTLVDDGLTFATGLAIDSNGTIYVSNFGVMPSMGQVVMIDLDDTEAWTSPGISPM